MSGRRLDGEGAVRRDRPLDFQFDGRAYAGFEGDTLASALLGAGVMLVGRSFKYHRPRGILCAGSEEPNALVELRSGSRREPNTRATVAELFEGLEATSQNRWPNLSIDLRAVNAWFSPLLVAGFYYKTFMWPRGFWERLYEPAIRRAAGLGRASHEPDPDGYEQVHAFCDLLVIGAGPAGLAAALCAGRAGARVLICDEDFLAGGRLHGDRRRIDAAPADHWLHATLAELQSLPHVTLLTRTTVFGVYDGGTYAALERVADHVRVPAPNQPRQRVWKIVARRAVLATGAIERSLVFADNDRPGIMLASAVRTYLRRFRVAAGRQVVVASSSDDGWTTAFDLREEGIEVSGVVDVRPSVAAPLVAEARRRGIACFVGAQIEGVHGSRQVRALRVRDAAGRRVRLPADAIAMSGGWTANIALSTHLGGRPAWSESKTSFVPAQMPVGMQAAGAAAGAFSLGDALAGGYAVAATAVRSLGLAVPGQPAWRTDDELGITSLISVAPTRGKAFVDFQHDVTGKDIEIATREGFRSIEHLKRYTTLGMATDQGKTSALNGHAYQAALTGRRLQDLGTIAARPPYTPVALAALAGRRRGRHFRPFRLTPSHAWAKAAGATFVESGEWLRAQWFARPGEADWLTTVNREVSTVRSAVGVCDVSTLGKIDVQGADAANFLDRVYCNLISTLPVGKARYGLMLREDGLVMDDGTVAGLASDHYVVTTTTANAARVMQHLEFARQVVWPHLDVQLAPVSEQWAQFAVAGPSSRQLLTLVLGRDLDISDAAFPYLACAAFSWQGRPARLFRVSFSGERAYEMAVPARDGERLWRVLLEAGASLGVAPYGVEALGVLRIEKGHVAGNELNGMTTASDLGLGKLMSTKKDYVGRVLAARPALADPQRPVLVGLRPLDPHRRLYAGSHFLTRGQRPLLENDQGFMSSVAYSPTLDGWLGLGFLARGRERIGERIVAHDPLRSGDTEVEVVSPVFYDPLGARLRQ